MPLLALVLVLASLLMLRPSNAQAEGIIEALENICGEMLELPDAGDGDAVTSLKEVRPSLKSVRRVSYPTGESEDGKKHNIPLITHMLQGKDGKVSCGRVLEDGVLLNFTAPLGSFAEMTPYVLTMFGENSSLSLTQQSDGIGSLLPMLKHGFLDTRKFLGTMASLWDPARGVRVAHRSLVEDSCSDTIDDPFNKYSVDPEKIMAPPNLVLSFEYSSKEESSLVLDIINVILNEEDEVNIEIFAPFYWTLVAQGKAHVVQTEEERHYHHVMECKTKLKEEQHKNILQLLQDQVEGNERRFVMLVKC